MDFSGSSNFMNSKAPIRKFKGYQNISKRQAPKKADAPKAETNEEEKKDVKDQFTSDENKATGGWGNPFGAIKSHLKGGKSKKTPVPFPSPEKELTVLYYMHGQYSDIGEATAEAMLNLERAGSDENVNVVAQLGRNAYEPKEAGEFHVPVDKDWSGIRRYYVKQDSHEKLDVPIEEWHKMESKMPKNPILYFVLGNYYWGMGDKSKGMGYFDKCKKLGMLDYMENYDSDKSKAIREEFDGITRPYDEASAPFKNFASEVQEELPGYAKMGDPATLEKFVSWGMEKYPAKHYMLVVMGHGGAWIGAAEQAPSEMADAIETGVSKANKDTGRDDKLDVLVFNSCYMGNVEAAYEFKDAAKVTLASENYARTGIFGHWGSFISAIQDDLKGGKPFNGRQFAHEMVDFYKKQGQEVKKNFPEFSAWKESYLTLSAIDNSKLDDLAGAFENFVKSCKKNKVTDKQLFSQVAETKDYDSNAHNPSQLMGFYDTIRDIGGLMKNVGKDEAMPQEVKDSAEKVLESLDACIINEQHEGKGMEDSHGLTFWGPTNAVDVTFMGNRYDGDVGKFAKKTGWSARLKQAVANVPKDVLKGFMNTIESIREINTKLGDESLSQAEKDELTRQKDDLNKKALALKEEMDFTLDRDSKLFKSYSKIPYNMLGEVGNQFADDLKASDGMS